MLAQSFKYLALAKLISANYDQMRDDLNKLMGTNITTRSFAEDDWGNIWNYGCWCNFQEQFNHGRGQVVDIFDEKCKQLHNGYSCSIMSAKNSGDSCVPFEVTYNSVIGSGVLGGGMTIENIQTECDNQNDPNTNYCANAACKVEGWFVVEIFQLFTGANYPDPAHQQENKADNYEWAVCLGGRMPGSADEDAVSGGGSSKACCGELPNSFPYRTQNGLRECCGDKTFNTGLY